ncbi:AAA family ATPase [Phycicoccus sp. 3266]|uniref:helix-turn-helix transcriptional regulator n=1 Tax=Phycicoccus sp. 3266 TaxID=2817751 RepID=UPI002863E7DD|nr:AAA family ATPase [Phycicoccus sp. 3266]MDR6862678.1 DNA-binding NarL/FixJ family response regulator [Phycicoccus sp. 3266]
MGGPATMIGRESERATVRAVVEGAALGEPGLLLVHGEPGIGKTTLVREAALAAERGDTNVLFGQCLRFGANVTSYVVFTQALTHWLHTTTSESRDSLAPGGRLDDLVPAINDASTGVALLQIGEVVDALQADRPTLVVLDDLQWCDPSSLDVLSYLVAGFLPGQRLGILATYRDTDLVEGHRLHGWLADALRMPRVAQLELSRLGAWDVEEMVLARGAAVSRPGLVEEVFRRSGGNPYLADLLIQNASSVVHGGDPVNNRLGDALLAAWHRLSGGGRTVTQLLAVAGGPVAFPVLRDFAARHAVAPEDVSHALTEAAREGITVETASGAIWFRHPLLAETIAGTMKSWERSELHSELAEIWQAAVQVDERDRANSLALHYVAAGDIDQGFVWSVRAANRADAVRGRDEEASHLSTAVSLVDLLPDEGAAQVDTVALLIRAGRACRGAGDDRGAAAHYENALARVARSGDSPLLASRILLELQMLRKRAADDAAPMSVSEPREVLALTERIPDSPERAQAFGQLAFAEVFNGIAEAHQHAESAVRLAERAGTAAALVWGHGARAHTLGGTVAGIADAERAFSLAAESKDPQLVRWAGLFLSNAYESVGRYADAATITGNAYRTLRDEGQFDYAATIGAMAARWNFVLGRWTQARGLVRELLTIARSHNAAATSRCVASLLAAHEGNRAAAVMHLRRAEDLMLNPAPVGDVLAETQIQVSIALGDPMGALDRIGEHMAEVVHASPRTADEWLKYASQAAAQLTQRSTDQEARRAALHRLEDIEANRGTQPAAFEAAGPLDFVHPALGALHAAQRAQGAVDTQALEQLWDAACEATLKADMRYEHARALVGLADHLLTHRHHRSRAATALADALRISIQLGAPPLTAVINRLVSQSHLHIPMPDTGGSKHPVSVLALPGTAALTTREREVLDPLLSGATYAQIARQLFISEKTVSSHVSNVLRKTGTTSRIELAALVSRDHSTTEQ